MFFCRKCYYKIIILDSRKLYLVFDKELYEIIIVYYFVLIIKLIKKIICECMVFQRKFLFGLEFRKQVLVVLDLFFFQMFIGIQIKCCDILCMYLDREEDFGILYD